MRYRHIITLPRLWLVLVALPMALGLQFVRGAALSEGYQSDPKQPAGTIVSLDREASRKVKAATRDNVDDLVGVVVVPEDTLISLSSGDNEVQVASSGVAATLVSTLGGDIKAGDRITASQIEGVGMKANSPTKVVGIAQADFSSSTEGAIKRDVQTVDGSTQGVSIGKIPVIINVTYFAAGEEERSAVPSIIRDLADAIAGKQVSAVRILVSAALVTLVIVIDSMFVYGSVRGSIISIGRNPLSSGSIRRSLFQVLFLAMIVLLVTLGAVYLILTR